MNNVSMPKVDITETTELNDKDILTCLLTIEKNMSNNLNIALNEASNEVLYKKLKNIYEEIRKFQREIYELSFSLGFYTLEKADTNKISTAINKLSQEKSQL